MCCFVQHCPQFSHIAEQKLGQLSSLLVCDFLHSLGPHSCLFLCMGMCVVFSVAVFCMLQATSSLQAVSYETILDKQLTTLKLA